MLRLVGDDLLSLAGGVLGLGGVRGRAIGDLARTGDLDRDLRCLLGGLCLELKISFVRFAINTKNRMILP